MKIIIVTKGNITGSHPGRCEPVILEIINNAVKEKKVIRVR